MLSKDIKKILLKNCEDEQTKKFTEDIFNYELRGEKNYKDKYEDFIDYYFNERD